MIYSQKFLLAVLTITAFITNEKAIAQSAAADTVSININLNKEIGSMKPIWACWGYDEPNYTYMKDGKKLLSEIAALSPVPL